jgi:CelD/BcsL family acetyltransferase involved in cellulose biosynthesis
MRLELVDDFDMLGALEPAWWDLWRRARSATPFQTPAWLLPWWRYFAPGELATFAAWQDGRLVVLAPLYLEHGARERRILPLGVGISDYLDILIDPDLEAAARGMFLDAAVRQCPAGAQWHFEELPASAAALRLEPPPSVLDTTERQSVCPVLNLSQPISAGLQRRLRRGERRARRLGGVSIRDVDDCAIDRFLDSLFSLHSARWQQNGEGGVLGDRTVQAFHRAVLPALAEIGVARLFELRIGGAVVACYYGFFDRRRAYAYIGGFDPRFSAVSPGNLMIAHAIADAKREGGTEFHFLRGRESYKYEWGAQDQWNQKRILARRVANVGI